MAGNMVRWGILGPGRIARDFMEGATASPTGKVVAVGTRDPRRPEIAENFRGLRVHAGYDALLAAPDIDAIYIATPHPFHAEWAIKAAQAGKHVLSEKPAGMNAAEVEAMFAAASANDTFSAEAFMYRLHPLTAFVLNLLNAGKIGDLRLIRSSFGFAMPVFIPEHRLFKKELGGGAILDLGGYPMSMARLLAGHAEARDDILPVDVSGHTRHGPTDVDEIASATAVFSNGVIAQMSVSLALWQDNVLHVMGTAGRLEVDSFWFGAGKRGGVSEIRFIPPHGATEIIPFHDDHNVYSFQFEAANQAICEGRKRFRYPGMTEADSVANAHSLDMWIANTKCVEPALPLPPLSSGQAHRGR